MIRPGLAMLAYIGALVGLVGGADLAAAQRAPAYDLVLRGGRVIDPESGLDAVRNVGIRNGRITAVTTRRIGGRETVDVSGLVVAPGFIDLHVHVLDSTTFRYFAHDGVTTALDLEGGVFPVAPWYATRMGHALINFGAAVGHRPARIALLQGASALTDPATLTDTAAPWARQSLGPGQLPELQALIERALDEGGLGVGSILQQMPAASHDEVLRVLESAARRGVVSFIHLRYQGDAEPGSGFEALQEIIADLTVTGGAAHIVHVTSVGLRQTPLLLEAIERARAHGVDVSTEAYPYEAINQRLSSAMFDAGWQQRLGISYRDILWPPTGERLTAESFTQYRADGGLQAAVIFAIPDSMVTIAIARPEVIVASDAGAFVEGRGHPRIAGTRARVLGRYVRERRALTLIDAIGKMSLLPARRLEKSVPQMRAKGRVRVGMDADLAIFDAARVIDRATYEDPAQYSEGIVHVLVGGTFVVRDGQFVDGVSPGRAIRRPVRERVP
jgi:N-acyl-D-aspartate/D-glutamate deacylase